MSLPTSEPVPFPEDELPPARRRRQKRLVLPEGEDERARILDELGLRLTPGLEFFLSALLSGILFGLALVFDSPGLVVLAVLLAPFMGPALGPSLAAVAGSFGYLLRSLGWLLTAGLIYFLSGTLAGITARILPSASAQQAAVHLNLEWGGMVLLTVGVVFTVYLMARSGAAKPLVSSVAVAYGLFLPLGAAGFGLTAGVGPAWMNGLMVFGVHLVWTALCGAIVLAVVGLRPNSAPGYLLTTAYLALCLLAALPLVFLAPRTPVGLAHSGSPTPPAAVAQSPSAAAPAAIVTASAPSTTAAVEPAEPPAGSEPEASPSAVTPPEPAATATITPSSTPTRTLVPTNTPTITVTPQATPVWARINAKDGDGAFIRQEPSYQADIIVSLLNGTVVQVLPDVVDVKGVPWMKVRTDDGREGWIVRALLATATPAPNW